MQGYNEVADSGHQFSVREYDNTIEYMVFVNKSNAETYANITRPKEIIREQFDNLIAFTVTDEDYKHDLTIILNKLLDGYDKV